MSISNHKPEKGRFLISEPFLLDPNFKRSVVLLTEHGVEGSVGFVLNQKVDLKLNEIIEDFPEFDVPVYIGGPVQQDSLHFIHRIDELREEAIEVRPGVYWGGDFDKLRQMVTAQAVPQADIRFFIGYSGWAPEQLSQELDRNSWIVAPPSRKFTFFDDPATLWKRILTALGNKYKRMADYPEDPSLN